MSGPTNHDIPDYLSEFMWAQHSTSNKEYSYFLFSDQVGNDYVVLQQNYKCKSLKICFFILYI